MKTYWRTLSQRERLLVSMGIIVVLAIILYVSVIEPRYQRLRMLRTMVPAAQSELAWMQAQIKKHQRLIADRNQGTQQKKIPLLTIVEQTATAAQLRDSISRMQPAEGGRVRVWFDDVYFDPWLRWVDSISQQKILVNAANIDRVADGKVNIRVTLGSP